jgi:RecA-family ATPase
MKRPGTVPPNVRAEIDRAARADERARLKVNGAGPMIEPFATFNARDWKDKKREPQKWFVRNRIPIGEVGIISGDGGTGKTLLGLQACVAGAAERPDWLNGILDRNGPALIYSAEEKLRQMHWRTGCILEHFKLTWDDFGDRLHFICDPDDPVLATIDPRTGLAAPTLALHRLEKTVEKIKPVFVLIENAAEVYPASEIVRSPISRFVRKVLGSLTVASEAAVGLIQHPSVSGLKDGTGRSGTTGWSNAGRWRLNFTKVDDEDAPDTGVRQLHVIKSNYGPEGEKVKVVWRNGVFVPLTRGSLLERAASEGAVDEVFLTCLDAATEQGVDVHLTTGKSYAPSHFAQMSQANGYGGKSFEKAMQRLLDAKKIKNAPYGPPSRNTRRLERY